MIFSSIFSKRVQRKGPKDTDDDRSEESNVMGSSTSAAQPDGGVDDNETFDEIDTSGWPPAVEYAPEQPTTDEFLGNIRSTDEHLDIKVGKDKFIYRWRAHKALLCKYSGYFRQACQPTGIADASFREGTDGIFDLHDDNPAAFELFLDWLYSNKTEPIRHEPDKLTNWNIYPVEAYALGDKLMADDLRPFALKKAIDSARYFDRRDIEIIFELTGPHDPLYRFTCRWLRWRCREDPFLWADSRNEILQTERSRLEPIGSIAGKDPLAFVQQHWLEPCCEISRLCRHEQYAWSGPFSLNENCRKLGKARMRRAWIRRQVYGYRHQFTRMLAAYGLFMYACVMLIEKYEY